MRLPSSWVMPLVLLGAQSAILSATQAPQVAVAPFTVINDTAGTVRQAADSCLAELTAGLKTRGIRLARHPSLDPKDLAPAQPAPWAVVGEFKREKGGRVQAELRLLAVPSGEEMRSYFNTGDAAKTLVPLGAKVAERGRDLCEGDPTRQPALTQPPKPTRSGCRNPGCSFVVTGGQDFHLATRRVSHAEVHDNRERA